MTIKEILILLLLTTVMGYILGLMISTTVNYKLKDFIVNLPRPIIKMKHPLIVNLAFFVIIRRFTDRIRL